MMRTVVCMKWGTLYSHEYVNVLYGACRKYLKSEFKFVCFTDDPTALHVDIEHHPIPDIGLEQAHYYDGAWPKISVFLEHSTILKGRCLFIDLDTVILSELDDFFEVPGDLVAIDWAPWKFKNRAPMTMSSIFSFDAGALVYLVDRLKSDRDSLIKKYRLEQDFLHGEIQGIRYWPNEWLVSFKYHVRRPLLLDRIQTPKKPSSPVKALIFHGRPRPVDLVYPKEGNWDVFPHYGSGVVPWMRDYWTSMLSCNI